MAEPNIKQIIEDERVRNVVKTQYNLARERILKDT